MAVRIALRAISCGGAALVLLKETTCRGGGVEEGTSLDVVAQGAGRQISGYVAVSPTSEDTDVYRPMIHLAPMMCWPPA